MTKDQERALAAARSKEMQEQAKRVNAAYTPGPWYHHDPSGSQHTAGGFISNTQERNDSPVICGVYGTNGQPFSANARLIAAAPDLLGALIAMEREKSDYMRLNRLGDPANETTNKMARAAIAKATGTPPPSDTGAETP